MTAEEQEENQSNGSWVVADLTGLTDVAIANKALDLARKLYSMQGYKVPEGYRFDTARHPHEQLIWEMVVLVFEELTATDVNDAVLSLDE